MMGVLFLRTLKKEVKISKKIACHIFALKNCTACKIVLFASDSCKSLLGHMMHSGSGGHTSWKWLAGAQETVWQTVRLCTVKVGKVILLLIFTFFLNIFKRDPSIHGDQYPGVMVNWMPEHTEGLYFIPHSPEYYLKIFLPQLLL